MPLVTYRAYKISSAYLSLHNELEFLKKIFQLNGHPLDFVERQIRKTLNKFLDPPNPPTNVDDYIPMEAKSVLFVTYFLGSHSDKLRNDLRNLTKEYLPNAKLQVIFRSGCVIGDLFGFKDKLPESCMSCFIYKYACESCNAFYIGNSYRQFKVRLFEHMGKSYHTGSFLGCPVHSEIGDHCREIML